jgi:hypothetical protein
MILNMVQIYKLFDYLNEKCFDNSLPKIQIKISNCSPRTMLGKFQYSILKKCSITIYPKRIDLDSEATYENTLLHEMVHFYTFMKYGNDKNNPLFTDKDIPRKSLKKLISHNFEFHNLLKTRQLILDNINNSESKNKHKNLGDVLNGGIIRAIEINNGKQIRFKVQIGNTMMWEENKND